MRDSIRSRHPALARFLASVFCLAVTWTFSVHAQENSAWARIVIVGASVSAGYTRSTVGPKTEAYARNPLTTPRTYWSTAGPIVPKTNDYALDRYLNAALLAPHEPARNLASIWFFENPDLRGSTQIRQALTNHPTLVVGVDFLFWFCYGKGKSDQERLDHFEKGLKLLEEVECSLIIGDIPDASAATNGMLSPQEIPSPAVHLEANRRLKEWAAQHQQVTVVPLAKFMSAVCANEALLVHGHAIAGGTTGALLQEDRLHPSPRGCATLAVSILDAFLAGHPGYDATQMRWDPDEVLKAAVQ